VGIVLTISVLLEHYWIAGFFPQLGELGGLRPMIVFLDIPLALPKIDWIPVGFIFIFFYGMAISSGLKHRGHPPGALRREKMAAALTGWWLLLLCILAGGALYALVQHFLPRAVRNGIDSFGVRADITLPYPSGELVHLHGSMLLLAFTGLGIHLLLKKTSLPPADDPATADLRTTVQTAAPLPEKTTAPATSRKEAQGDDLFRPSYQHAAIPSTGRRTPGTVQDQYLTPEPSPDCRLTTPPPVAVILPRAAPRIGSIQPCVVAGMIEPART
jgi:hypothetical protein